MTIIAVPSQYIVCQVAVPVPAQRGGVTIYDYLAPRDWNLVKGHVVQIPIASRQGWGIVMGTAQKTEIEASKIKTVTRLAHVPPLSQKNISYLEQLTKWTLAPFSAAMKLMLNCPQALEAPKAVSLYHLSAKDADEIQHLMAQSGLKMTPKRERLLHAMLQLPPLSLAELAAETATSTSVITSLVQAAILTKTQSLVSASYDDAEALIQAADRLDNRLTLTPEQTRISDEIKKGWQNGFGVHLVEGVPGSGKTETYLSVVAQALRQRRQVIIMLPEIVLTTAWQERFERWFGLAPQIWHSSIPMSKRRQIWRGAIQGEPMVVAGARSLLSLPFSNLGLIVVDEEHDSSFKQEDYISYHARDMAMMRAKIHNIPILLASATPSVESWVRATDSSLGQQQKHWHHWQLSSRFGNAELPQVSLIDLRLSPPPMGRWISPELEKHLGYALTQHTQSLLFLNRRGYAPMTLCTSCGYRMACHQCDSLLVTHKLAAKRQCHVCGHVEKLTDECPQCGVTDCMQPIGPGVERLVDEAQTLFPEARIAILSSDSVAQAGAADRLIQDISDGHIDIIIGTQMAAKGHHFPHLGLVGVVDADLGLGGGDLRAAERTYQLLWQVAGRSGREGGRTGQVFIQTYQPDHLVMQALVTLNSDTSKANIENAEAASAQQRAHFMHTEAMGRKMAGMPPFGRLASLILSAPDIVKLEQAAGLFELHRPHYEATQIYGPAPAAISRARGQFRMRYLLRADRHVSVQQILLQWIEAVKLPSGVTAQVDIDPYNFL